MLPIELKKIILDYQIAVYLYDIKYMKKQSIWIDPYFKLGSNPRHVCFSGTRENWRQYYPCDVCGEWNAWSCNNCMQGSHLDWRNLD